MAARRKTNGPLASVVAEIGLPLALILGYAVYAAITNNRRANPGMPLFRGVGLPRLANPGMPMVRRGGRQGATIWWRPGIPL